MAAYDLHRRPSYPSIAQHLRHVPAAEEQLHLSLDRGRAERSGSADPAASDGSGERQGQRAAAASEPAQQPHGDRRNIRRGAIARAVVGAAPIGAAVSRHACRPGARAARAAAVRSRVDGAAAASAPGGAGRDVAQKPQDAVSESAAANAAPAAAARHAAIALPDPQGAFAGPALDAGGHLLRAGAAGKRRGQVPAADRGLRRFRGAAAQLYSRDLRKPYCSRIALRYGAIGGAGNCADAYDWRKHSALLFSTSVIVCVTLPLASSCRIIVTGYCDLSWQLPRWSSFWSLL